MTEIAGIPFDFKAPGRLASDVERALDDWHAQTCTLLNEGLQSLVGNTVTVTMGELSSGTAGDILKQTADPGYAASLRLGTAEVPSLVTFSGDMIATLVSGVLGDIGEDWKEFEPLTTVETSMLELLFGEVTRTVGMGWPELEPLPCRLDACLYRPMRSRIYAPDEGLLQRELIIETPFGKQSAWWLLQVDRLTDIGMSSLDSLSDADVLPDERLPAIAATLPVDIVVQLGTTRISLPEMNELEVGDFLVLDQNVQQPVEAFLAGRLQWLGMPCRLGRHQGFEILASKR
ncbi:MAG: FliM/FliN family flagellar motor switch protein [Planctomycetaceae bacterium]|nr:FliM/FliN family flagellar motor switch protein [Planctomycetaceae bacterium]